MAKTKTEAPVRRQQGRRRRVWSGDPKGRTPSSPPADPNSPDAGRPNWKDKTIFTGDNLHVLRGMNSDSVDLIYLDPPFNSDRNYAAPLGGGAVAAFKDTWTLSDVDKAWHGQLEHDNPRLHKIILAAWSASGKKTASYLMMMAVRLVEMKRVLKDTGSIYLHCDDAEAHYLRMLMDAIFGKANFVNEIVWERVKGAGKRNKHAPRSFGRTVDYLLFYANSGKYTFNLDEVALPLTEEQLEKFKLADEKGPYYRRSPFRPPGLGEAPGCCYEWRGFYPPHPSGWIGTEDFMEALDAAGDIEIVGGKIYRKQRPKGNPVHSLWKDIAQVGGKEDTFYPTQKPLDLLERIIRASSNEGDVVLDPFCGCATTPIAAEKLNRRWVGIDLSPLADQLVRGRLRSDLGLTSSVTVHRTVTGKGAERLMRTDLGKLPHYRTHKRDLFRDQEGYCAGCGYDFGIEDFDVDHIISRNSGGTDHKANLQLLCKRCNGRKRDGEMSELVAILIEEEVGQYA